MPSCQTPSPVSHVYIWGVNRIVPHATERTRDACRVIAIVGRGGDGVKALRVNNRALAFCDAQWLLRSLIENAPVSVGKDTNGEGFGRDSGNLFAKPQEPTIVNEYDSICPASVHRRIVGRCVAPSAGELSIQVESCPDFARAAIRPAQQRFDVVIIDGDCQDVISLLRETRLVSAERCDACGGGGPHAGKHSRAVLAGR